MMRGSICRRAFALFVVAGVAGSANGQLFTDFTNFTLNEEDAGGGHFLNSPNPDDTYQATDGFGSEGSSAFFNNKVDISSGFQMSFHYVATNPNAGDPGNLGIADGLTFVIQNDPNGVNAIGRGGDGLGYDGIQNSVAVALDVWGGVPGGPGTQFYQNGHAGPGDHNYQSTGLVDLTSAAGVDVTITYDATTHKLDEQLFQASSFFDVFTTIDIGADLGGNLGYMGFTGADGGGWSDQRVSHVRVVTPEPFSMSLIGASALGAFLRMRRRKIAA